MFNLHYSVTMKTIQDIIQRSQIYLRFISDLTENISGPGGGMLTSQIDTCINKVSLPVAPSVKDRWGYT